MTIREEKLDSSGYNMPLLIQGSPELVSLLPPLLPNSLPLLHALS
jgi:hypothetical protein